jgi:hypothetical protein
MKLKTLLIIAGVLFTIVCIHRFGYGQQKQWVEDYTVQANTSTAVMVGMYEPTRKYYAVGNWSDKYIVFHATFPVKQTDIDQTVSTSGVCMGIPLAPYQNGSDLNVWIDQYNIYTSTWYVLISSVNAIGSKITCNVTYRQRK